MTTNQPSNPIQVSVTFDSANRRKDRSVKCTFTTNLELSTDDYAQMDRLVHQAGWLLFSPNELQLPDVPSEDAPSDFKRPSVHLRGCIYRWWEQEKTAGRTTMSDEEFYKAKMRTLVDWVKEHLT